MRFPKIPILLFVFTSSFAQKKENIEKIKTKFSVAPFYVKEYSYLSIHNRDKTSSDILYYPNISGVVGAHFFYKFIGFSLAFKLPKSSEYTDTKMIKIGLDLTGNKLGFAILYNRYKGLYLYNNEDFMQTDKINFPEMTMSYFRISSQFIFSKRFSYKAAFKQSERQKTSAGSFLILANNTFSTLSNNESFIPFSERENFSKTEEIDAIKSNTMNMALAYAYTFVISKNFAASSIFAAGMGLNTKRYFVGLIPHFSVRLPWYFYSKTAIGYNGDSFFCNITYTIDYNNIRFSESDFNIIRNFLKLNVGYRIIKK